MVPTGQTATMETPTTQNGEYSVAKGFCEVAAV